jgi:hypothetical protein
MGARSRNELFNSNLTRGHDIPCINRDAGHTLAAVVGVVVVVVNVVVANEADGAAVTAVEVSFSLLRQSDLIEICLTTYIITV